MCAAGGVGTCRGRRRSAARGQQPAGSRMVAAAPPVGPNSQEQHRRQRQKQQIAAWEAAVPRRRQHVFKRAAGGRVRSLPAPACSVPVLAMDQQCSKTAYRQHAPPQFCRAAAVADGGHVLRLRRPCSCRASKRMREDRMNDANKPRDRPRTQSLRSEADPGAFLRYPERARALVLATARIHFGSEQFGRGGVVPAARGMRSSRVIFTYETSAHFP